MSSIYDIGAAILKQKETVTLEDLMNLLFMADSWHYAFTDHLLFTEPLYTCDEGIKLANNVSLSTFLNKGIYKGLETDVKETLKAILGYYGKMNSVELCTAVKVTHAWQNAASMPNKLMNELDIRREFMKNVGK